MSIRRFHEPTCKAFACLFCKYAQLLILQLLLINNNKQSRLFKPKRMSPLMLNG